MSRAVNAMLTGPCLCDGRYDGCGHDKPCGQPNDRSKRGPWCADCSPRRLDHVSQSLERMASDFRGAS